jgi:Xaa-Pro dipeptidase
MSAEQGDPLRVEILRRQQRIKEEMAKRRVDALVLTGQASFEYFTGYRSAFWASTTRPFYAVIVPDRHATTIIVHQSEQRSTEFDIADSEFILYRLFLGDALRTLRDTVAKLAPTAKRIGLDYGNDLFGRGSLILDDSLRNLSSRPEVIEGDEIIWSVRAIKSEYEIEMKRRACHIAPQSFFAALKELKLGQTERDFGRAVTINMLQRGADYVDFLPVRFGKSKFAYLRPASDKPLEPDDFIWVDMGCVVSGYHSDLNRIAKAGETTEFERTAYRFIRDLTIELAKNIRPGMPCPDIIREFERLWTPGAFGKPFVSAARIGHGSGMGLTEPPSIMEGSKEVVLPGMVLHLEPKIETDSGVFQVEEVFVVRDNGVEFLSDIAPSELPSLA